MHPQDMRRWVDMEVLYHQLKHSTLVIIDHFTFDVRTPSCTTELRSTPTNLRVVVASCVGEVYHKGQEMGLVQ